MDIQFISIINLFTNLLTTIFPKGFGNKINEIDNLYQNEFL